MHGRAITLKDGLTLGEAKFLVHVLRGLLPKEAYAKAYPRASAKNCQTRASKLLAKPASRAYLEKWHEQTSHAAGLERTAMLRRVHELTLIDRSAFFDNAGRILPRDKWPAGGWQIVRKHVAGSANRGEEIEFVSVAEELHWLTEATAPADKRPGGVNVNLNVQQGAADFDELMRVLDEREQRLIDVTPTPPPA